jgi:hypothetical protein
MHLHQLAKMLESLVGQRVTDKHVAGNSISVWFAVPSQAPDARGIWIEPYWRIEGPHGVESSCDGFPGDQQEGESKQEYRARFEAACARSDSLKGLRLEAVQVDLHLGDIALAFEGGRALRSFTTETDWENWHYEDHQVARKYRVLGTVVSSEAADA